MARLSFGSAAGGAADTADESSLRAYLGFLVCRVSLGFFEAGQWPCALVTTQRLLSRADRSFGNSILQSGASIGAILTPVVIGLFAPPTLPAGTTSGVSDILSQLPATEYAGWWRLPYVVIGALGLLWIAPWLLIVRGLDLRRPDRANEATGGSAAVPSTVAWITFARRFLALVVTVIVINMVWQYFRVWLPKMLEQYHGYRPDHVRVFVIAYYISTDVGCICSGAAVKFLAQRGWDVHRARMGIFGICAFLTALSTVAASLPAGPLLLVLFLIIGFGALGLFPNYYSFVQELSARHQGKVTGTLGFITWVVASEMQERVGKEIDATQSYASGIFWIGLAPLLGLAAMLLLWGRSISDGEGQDGAS
jgi:ACS family hexuronate transporter-like MFS transporter